MVKRLSGAKRVLDLDDLKILNYIYYQKKIRISKVIEEMSFSHKSFCVHRDRLVKLNLITCNRDSERHREKYLKINARGKSIANLLT